MGLFDWLFRKKKVDLKLNWHDQYETGIIEIDAQHKNLFMLYNGFVDLIYSGGSLDKLQKGLDGLLEYVILHFNTEEAYMLKYSFGGYEEHKAEHKALREKTYYLHKDFANGKPVLTMDVLLFIKGWISNHVLVCDMQYKDFLLSRLPKAYLA